MWQLTVSFAAYFVISQPAKGEQWVNGAVNPISWTKGLLDGVNSLDIELARLSQDGLIFVARDGTYSSSPPSTYPNSPPPCQPSTPLHAHQSLRHPQQAR